MEPPISPLAKRLAEENNVSWHALQGSGPAGRVVERDVLEYLARVMSGEAAADPAPEALPEGADAWTEDLGDEARGGIPAEDFDEALLELDALDDDEPLVAPAEDALDDFTFAEAFSGDETPSDDVFVTDGAEDALFGDEAALDEAEGFEVFERVGEADVQADAFDTGALDTETFEDDKSFDSEAEAFDEDFGAGWADAPRDADADVLSPAPLADDFGFAADVDGAELGSKSSDTSGGELGDEFGGAAGLEPDTQTASPADETDAFRFEGFGDALADVETAPAQPAEDVPAEDARGSGDDVGASPTSEPASLPDGLPVAPYGLLLRRHLDLTPLREAQRAAGEERKGGDTPPPTAFLLRAAFKALRAVPLKGSEAAVALALVSGNRFRTRAVGDADASLGVLLEETEQASSPVGQEGEREADTARADLLVADLSRYTLDEVVFNVGVPVLTLSRLGAAEEARGTLSLSGDVSPEWGAAFLERVAELLASPVRLLF